jgi:hypothetical protein
VPRPVTFATRHIHEPPLIAKYQWNDLKGRHTYIVRFQVAGRTVESNSGPIIGTAHDADVVTSAITSWGSDDRIFSTSAIDTAPMGATIFSEYHVCQCWVKNQRFGDLLPLCHQGQRYFQKILAHYSPWEFRLLQNGTHGFGSWLVQGIVLGSINNFIQRC